MVPQDAQWLSTDVKLQKEKNPPYIWKTKIEVLRAVLSSAVYSWWQNRKNLKGDPLSSRWCVLGSVPTTRVLSDLAAPFQMPPSEQRRILTKSSYGAGDVRASYTPDRRSCLPAFLPPVLYGSPGLTDWLTGCTCLCPPGFSFKPLQQ